MKFEILHIANNERVAYSSEKPLFLTTIQDTTCLRYMHESMNYPRDGYRAIDKDKYTIPKDTTIQIKDVWSNLIEGTMVRVVYNNIEMDIKPQHLKYEATKQ